MRKGQFSYFDKKMAAGFDLHVDSVSVGSLQPGTQQAVVIVACDFPIGGTAAAYLFDERKGRRASAAARKSAAANLGRRLGAGPSLRSTCRFAKNFL